MLLIGLLALVLAAWATTPTASASTPAPTGLRVASSTASALTLTWSGSSSAYYRVKWSADPDLDDPAYVVVHGTKAELSDLAAGTSYWFKVKVVTSDDDPLSSYSSATSGATGKVAASSTSASSSTKGLRVGSYNVRCSSCTSKRPYERPWSQRRDDVAAAIKKQDLDVVGLQEASQAWLKNSEGDKIDLSQFEDLRNALGGSWKLTNTNRNNCVRSKSPKSCKTKDQGASQGTKIVYNAKRVELVSQGSKILPSASRSTPRYLAWAILRQKSTGKKFFLADAHLEHGDHYTIRVEEAKVLAAEVAKRNTQHLPTLIVGDMNSHKHSKPSNGVYDVLVGQKHYIDPLGNTWYSTDKAGSHPKTATVGKRINTWLSSWNDFQKVAEGNRSRVNGTYLDYIFTTKMKVAEWETVADIDSHGRFRTAPPSDHNLIRATVLLP